MRQALKRWWRSTTAIVTYWRLRAATRERRRLELRYSRAVAVEQAFGEKQADHWNDWMAAWDVRQDAGRELRRAMKREERLAIRLTGRGA